MMLLGRLRFVVRGLSEEVLGRMKDRVRFLFVCMVLFLCCRRVGLLMLFCVSVLTEFLSS